MSVDQAQALRERLKYVEIPPPVRGSQLPYRVIRKRTGCTDGSFETKQQAEAFVLNMDITKLAMKPTRGKRR